MDNLVLIRVAASLRASLARGVLREVKEESRHRTRWVFELPQGTRSIVVSLRPELPWIGRPVGRYPGRGQQGSTVAALARKLLRGALLLDVSKDAHDRLLRFEFSDGHHLVAELATHGANLILLEARGRILATERRPKSAQKRLVQGSSYAPPPLPGRLRLPFEMGAEEIDRALTELAGRGETAFEALRRHFFGIGTAGARLVVAEARSTRRSEGSVLREHLDRLDRGEDDPVISGVEDPMRAADRGELATEEVVLLPWSPPERSSAWNALIRRADAATTAGLYHEAVERAQVFQSRVGGLLELLHREQQRVWAAEAKAEKDLSSFEDPERYRCWGEALLAGLAAATRVGEAFRVPDPYSTEGRDLLVPAEPGVSVQQAAERHFRRYRRAQRGLAQAAERSQSLRERGRRLRVLMDRFEGVRGLPAIEELEAAMRAEGIPVGLQATRRAREQARLERPRLEGVRIYSTDDGLTILVGKGARENHRLTFKLASPEDFWFHAQGHRGAHVILRNEGGLTAPPEESLRQAAAAAAWFSEARGEDRVDVQWTRRKNVRKPRSAPPGTVVIKRFRTVRVRPAEPGRGRAPA